MIKAKSTNFRWRGFFTVSAIYSIFMIGYELIPQELTIVLSLAFVCYCIVILIPLEGLLWSLCYTSLVLIPTSFVSIIGTDTADFPFSWFHIIIIVMMTHIIMKGGVSKKYLISFVLWFPYAVCNAAVQANVMDGLKQVLTISIFMFSFMIGYELKKQKELFQDISKALIAYFVGTVGFALQILLQYIVISRTNKVIGHYAQMGLGRNAYAGLMGDYSFAALYISTGCVLVMLLYFEYKKISLIQFLLFEGIFAFAMLISSARTGVAAFAFTVALYFMFNIRRIKGRHIIALLPVIILAPYYVYSFLNVRGNQSFFDGSGRFKNYREGFKVFLKNPAIGVGYGLENLSQKNISMVPHNFFIQYLLQSGIVGTILIVIPFLIFAKNDYREADCSKWLFVTVMVGAMFIPDIVASRFLYGIVVIVMTSIKSRTVR